MNTWIKQLIDYGDEHDDDDVHDDEHDESSWSWWCWWWNLIYRLYISLKPICEIFWNHVCKLSSCYIFNEDTFGLCTLANVKSICLTTERGNSFGQGHTMYEWYTETHILKDDGHSKALKSLENLQILHRMRSKSRDRHEWWTQHWSTMHIPSSWFTPHLQQKQ